VAVAARQAGISLTGLETDLRREVERLPAGSTRTPVFSRHLPVLFEHAWLIASLGTAGRWASSTASAAATCCWRC
jgi:type VI secretion system protein VasG